MITYRLSVFEQNGNWFFKWSNAANPKVCGGSGPLKSKEEAESAKEEFIEAEKKKRPWAVCESA
jgi:hypothetical protein